MLRVSNARAAERRVSALVAAGATPRYSGGDGLLLRAGKRYVRLSDDLGELTAAGHAYEAQTGHPLPVSGLQRQAPHRAGATETIKMRDGRRAVTRRWNKAKGEWDFTRLGRRFYQRLEEITWCSYP